MGKNPWIRQELQILFNVQERQPKKLQIYLRTKVVGFRLGVQAGGPRLSLAIQRALLGLEGSIMFKAKISFSLNYRLGFLYVFSV